MEKKIIIFLSLFSLFILANSAEAALSCSVTSGSCANTTVLKMSALTNAHAEVPGQTNYNYYVCCSGVTDLGNSCSGNYAIALKLSALTNAHVEKNSYTNYTNNACISASTGSTVICSYSTDCSTLGSDYVCLASISGNTNAHVGNCNAYSTKVCCAVAAAPIFDFHLSLDSPYGPASGSVTQGGYTTTVVGVIKDSGTAQSVDTFTASGLDPSMSYSFTPTSCTPDPNCQTQLTINTLATTPTRTYSINVCGTGGGQTHCIIYGLAVTGAVINHPPVLEEVSDHPDPQCEKVNITFSSVAHDPDNPSAGDVLTLYICKDNNCSETWAISVGGQVKTENPEATNVCPSLTPTSSPWTQGYWAKVCDNRGECSDIIPEPVSLLRVEGGLRSEGASSLGIDDDYIYVGGDTASGALYYHVYGWGATEIAPQSDAVLLKLNKSDLSVVNKKFFGDEDLNDGIIFWEDHCAVLEKNDQVDLTTAGSIRFWYKISSYYLINGWARFEISPNGTDWTTLWSKEGWQDETGVATVDVSGYTGLYYVRFKMCYGGSSYDIFEKEKGGVEFWFDNLVIAHYSENFEDVTDWTLDVLGKAKGSQVTDYKEGGSYAYKLWAIGDLSYYSDDSFKVKVDDNYVYALYGSSYYGFPFLVKLNKSDLSVVNTKKISWSFSRVWQGYSYQCYAFIRALFLNDDYIYLSGVLEACGGGHDLAFILKFNKSDLSFVSKQVYQNGGDYETAYEITPFYADNNYIYAQGLSGWSGSAGSKSSTLYTGIIKLNKSDLSIADSRWWGTLILNHVRQERFTSCYVDSDYIYCVGTTGQDSRNDGTLFKIRKSDLALMNAKKITVNDGVFYSKIDLSWISSSPGSNYLYAGGYRMIGPEAEPYHVVKRVLFKFNKSDLSIVNEKILSGTDPEDFLKPGLSSDGLLDNNFLYALGIVERAEKDPGWTIDSVSYAGSSNQDILLGKLDVQLFSTGACASVPSGFVFDDSHYFELVNYNPPSGGGLQLDSAPNNPSVEAVSISPIADIPFSSELFVLCGELYTFTCEDCAPQPPTATNLSVDPPNPNDYCVPTGYPPVRLRWQFSEPGDTQSAYQIQLDTDSNFSNPRGCPLSTDTKVSTEGQAGPDYSCLANNLSWNTTYYWRLKVWDSQDTPSTWIYPPSPPGSPTPSPGTPFDTISHAYPNPNFTFQDRVYSAGEVITFTDDSHCYKPDGTSYRCGTDEYAVTSYLWNFGDGATSFDKSATTTHAYNAADDYTVSLSVTDDLGTCSRANPVQVGVGLPLPEWKEISPF